MNSGPHRQQENGRDEEPGVGGTGTDPRPAHPPEDARGGGPGSGGGPHGTTRGGNRVRGSEHLPHEVNDPLEQRRRWGRQDAGAGQDGGQGRPGRTRGGEGTGHSTEGSGQRRDGGGRGQERGGERAGQDGGQGRPGRTRGGEDTGHSAEGSGEPRGGRGQEGGGERPGQGTGRPSEHPVNQRGRQQESGGGGFVPSWPSPRQRDVHAPGGWHIETRAELEQRSRGHRPEQGEGQTAPPGNHRQPARDAGTPSHGGTPQRLRSNDAADGNPTDAYKTFDERHGTGGRADSWQKETDPKQGGRAESTQRDRTDFSSQLPRPDKGHGSPGDAHRSTETRPQESAPQQRTDFHTSISGSRAEGTSSSHDDKPPSGSGIGGHRG